MADPVEQAQARPAAAEPKPAPRGISAAFDRMPAAERLLGAAALAVVLAFLIHGDWAALIGRWFEACALIGAGGVLALTAMDLWRVRFLAGGIRTYARLVFAAAPAVGFVIGSLEDFWRAAMLAGAVVMGYAAVKIVVREDLF